MIANANYDGNNIHKSLSITPLNDIKDMLGLLEKSEMYGLENTYEDVESSNHMNDIIGSYVESLNKFSEEIELLVIYYSGLIVKVTDFYLAMLHSINMGEIVIIP